MDWNMIIMMVIWIGFAIFSSVIFVEGRRKVMFTVYGIGGILFSIIAFSDIIFTYMKGSYHLIEFWLWISLFAASFIPIVILMFFVILVYGEHKVLEYFHVFAILYIIFYIIPTVLISIHSHKSIVKNSIFLGFSCVFSFYDIFWLIVFLFVLILGWTTAVSTKSMSKRNIIVLITFITFINIFIISGIYLFHLSYIFKWIDYFISYIVLGYVIIHYEKIGKGMSFLHDRVFDILPIGVIVFDDYKELIKMNRVAERILESKRISLDIIKNFLRDGEIIKFAEKDMLYSEVYKYENNYIVVIVDRIEELLPQKFVDKYKEICEWVKEDDMSSIVRFLEEYGIEGIYWERFLINKYNVVSSDNSFNISLLSKEIEMRYQNFLGKTGEFIFCKDDDSFYRIKKKSVEGEYLYILSLGYGSFRVMISFLFNLSRSLTERDRILMSIVFHLVVEGYLKKELG